MQKPMTTAVLALALALTLTLTGCAGPNDRQSAVTASSGFEISSVNLPGEGRGDYIGVDADARRLYVTHTGSVHVLDLDTLTPLAQIDGFSKAHGVAIAPMAGVGFISDGGGNSISVFDLRTNRVSKIIRGGENPDSVIYDPASKMVFVFNGLSKDISVIDPASKTIVRTIALGDKPESARTDGRGKIFVNLEERAAIAVIDTSTLRIAAEYKLRGCEGPAAIALDSAHRRLFTSCGNNRMLAVDADNGKILASIPVGDDPDGIIYDPEVQRVFVAARNGMMTVIKQDDADHYSVEQNLNVEEYAKTLAFDPATHRIFSSTAQLVWPQEVHGQKHLPDAKPGTFHLVVYTPK
ncbi:MAG: YncE family protein [Croceibacterium sp.]